MSKFTLPSALIMKWTHEFNRIKLNFIKTPHYQNIPFNVTELQVIEIDKVHIFDVIGVWARSPDANVNFPPRGKKKKKDKLKMVEVM